MQYSKTHRNAKIKLQNDLRRGTTAPEGNIMHTYQNLFDIQASYNVWAANVMAKERPTRLDLCELDRIIHEAQTIEEEEYYKQRVVSVLLFVREQTKIAIDRLNAIGGN